MNSPYISRVPLHVLSCAAACSVLMAGPVKGAGTVTVADDAHLRSALAGGGTVAFACDGTITLTDTLAIAQDTVLDASGHSITVSGNNTLRIFQVAPGASLSLTNLVLANGQSTNGGAIYNEGSLSAISCTFVSDVVVATAGVSANVPPLEGSGGAVYTTGTAHFAHCAFSNNEARGADGFGPGFPDAPASGGAGGAVYSIGVSDFELCTFSTNTAAGGNKQWGDAPGRGGALCNGGTLRVSQSSFNGNLSQGGYATADEMPWSGRPGYGGAIYNDRTAVVSGCMFAWNEAVGGNGATGSIEGSGSGGSAMGGAVCSAGTMFCTNSTFYENLAQGGAAEPAFGAAGFAGDGLGGAVYVLSNRVVLSFCTLADNQAMVAANPWLPGIAQGGGVACQTGAEAAIHSSIIAYHPQGLGFSGDIADLGYNVCSDASGGFTNTGSLNNVDPELGPLLNNGGPTLTMLPRPTSPAIGAGDTAHSPPADERGVPRPQYGSCDAGAVEFDGVLPRVLRFASASLRGVEGTDALVTVMCGGNPVGAVSVQCATADGTAIAPRDYAATNLVLSFNTGETNKTFAVHIPENSTLDTNKTVLLVLSNPTGRAALDVPSNSILTIADKALPNGVDSTAEFLAAASVGGEVTFGNNGVYSISNTIVVTNALTVDGRLRQVVLSGNNRSRLFLVKDGGNLVLRDLTLTGGYSTNGGAILNEGGQVEVDRCLFAANQAIGLAPVPVWLPYPHPATEGVGGAVSNHRGTLRISNSIFRGNRAAGANASAYAEWSAGASGRGGAIYNHETMFLESSTLEDNSVAGGDGDQGYPIGSGLGGGIYNVGALTVTNTTFFGNTAAAGHLLEVPFPTPADARGAGVFAAAGTTILQNVTLAGNFIDATNAAVPRGFDIGVSTGQVFVCDSILAGAPGATNCYGPLIDLGYNLSSDASCAFTNTGSVNGVDPMLGPLADNGGPTPTMALTAGSPAIDAGIAVPGVTTDQRGAARPFGAAPDIGAFEWMDSPFYTQILLAPPVFANNVWRIRGTGPANLDFCLSASTNLLDWIDLSITNTGPSGRFEFDDPSNWPSRYYRTRSP